MPRWNRNDADEKEKERRGKRRKKTEGWRSLLLF